MTKFFCDICTAPMKQVSKSTVKGKRGNMRKRRFQCTICDFQKTIYADGGLDVDRYDSEIEEANKKELSTRKIEDNEQYT